VRTLRRLRVWFSEGVSMMAVAVQGPPEGASDAIRIHSKSIEEATDQVGRVFHPHELTRVERVSRFHADLEAVSTGPIVSGRLEYYSNSDLYCPAIDGYHVNVPLSGRLRSVRLRRVHEDLVNALPDTTSVASAASKWGFYHHGRFAAAPHKWTKLRGHVNLPDGPMRRAVYRALGLTRCPRRSYRG
jgi:AraC-binding-like domain